MYFGKKNDGMKQFGWLAVIFFSFASFGQMNTDRPSYSFGAQTIEKGEFQMETGISLNATNLGTNFVQAPTTTLRLAVGNRFELRMQNLLEFRKNSFTGILVGIGNVEVGGKFHALSRENTNIAVVLQGILPTATGFGMYPTNGGKGVMSVTQSVSKNGTLGSNIGYELSAPIKAVLESDLFYTVYYSYQLRSSVAVFAEVFQLFPNVSQFDKNTIECNFDCGFTYGLGRNIQIDYSFGFGLLERTNFQAIGVSFRIQPPPQGRMY